MNIFENSVRCPDCRDLFIPEDGKLPVHFLDTFDGTECCSGSGVLRLGWALGDGNYAHEDRKPLGWTGSDAGAPITFHPTAS